MTLTKRSRFRSFAVGLAVLCVATTFMGCGKHCEEIVTDEQWSIADLETLIGDADGGDAGAEPDADLVEASADGATVIDAGPDVDAGKLPDAGARSEASMWMSRECTGLCTELNRATTSRHHDAHPLGCGWSGYGSTARLACAYGTGQETCSRTNIHDVNVPVPNGAFR